MRIQTLQMAEETLDCTDMGNLCKLQRRDKEHVIEMDEVVEFIK